MDLLPVEWALLIGAVLICAVGVLIWVDGQALTAACRRWARKG